jgi:C1A family cysteine protease
MAKKTVKKETKKTVKKAVKKPSPDVQNVLKPKDKAFFGWTPDTPDHRDVIFKLPKKLKKLPTQVDLRSNDVVVFDQGSLGSCTANAISTAFIYNLVKQEEPMFVPSRLFVYYNTRLLEGNIDRDSGATLRNTVKSINKVGLCEEPFWPYDIKKFKSKPAPKSYTDAEGNKAVKYERLSRSLYDFKSCLAAGYPFVCGFAVYESFQTKEVAKTGKMVMPGPNESSLGGHAVLVIGYDDETQCFIVRNSWGTKWGDKGHFYMPYEYLLNRNLSDDFWVIQKVIS